MTYPKGQNYGTHAEYFLSHGAPSYALDPGLAGEQLIALGKQLSIPKAVLIVSPHWTTSGSKVATSLKPDTIHDFGGFSPALYQLQYPASGHPELAERAIELLRNAGWNAPMYLIDIAAK